MGTGAKYEKGMDTAEIAKRIRADVKAAQKSGKLPAPLKVSVTMERFSGGSSIDIRVKSVPFKLHDSEYVAFHVATKGHQHYDKERYTPRALALLKTLEAIGEEYRRDDSDSMTDYFNNNFYFAVQYGSEAQREDMEVQSSYYEALAA